MSNKHAYGSNNRSMFNQKDGHNSVFYFGKVEGNVDDFDGGTIRVRIKNVDDHIKAVTDLPSCFPLTEKFFHVTPKVGETVIVFVPDAGNPYFDRVYSGPIISQPQYLFKDNDFVTSKSMLDSGVTEPREAPSTIPENLGVHPKPEDVAIQGRDNADIILRPNEVLIRAGKFITNPKKEDVKKFNKDNPAYIQLRHDVIIKAHDTSAKTKGEINGEKGTVINAVANKINLLTHKEGQPRFTLNDQNQQITDEELLKILEDAHELVFGDLLVEYLKLQRAAFLNHVHPFHGLKPQDRGGHEDIDAYTEFDLNRLLSKNIRIN